MHLIITGTTAAPVLESELAQPLDDTIHRKIMNDNCSHVLLWGNIKGKTMMSKKKKKQICLIM